jgi:hypothetical protein
MKALAWSATIAVSVPLGAQSPSGGQLPVLAPELSASGRCRVDSGGGRRNIGIVKLIGFADSLSEPHRLLALGLGASARPRMLTAIIDSHGLTESVVVFFDDGGRVVRGNRDLNGETKLLPSDTAAAIALARSLMQRCPG